MVSLSSMVTTTNVYLFSYMVTYVGFDLGFT